MTFRTYISFATAAVVGAAFSVVDGAVGQSAEPPAKAAVQHVASQSR